MESKSEFGPSYDPSELETDRWSSNNMMISKVRFEPLPEEMQSQVEEALEV